MTPNPMTTNPLAGHVRRYPIWYSVFAGWVAVMILLPAIGVDPIGAALDPAPRPRAAVSTSPPSSGVAPVDLTVGPDVTTRETTPTTTPARPPVELDPTEPAVARPLDALVDLVFDALPPPLAVPDAPPELRALLAAFGPITTFGCTQLGLVSALLAVTGLLQIPGAEDVPLARLVSRLAPFLIPVTTACAHFDLPSEHSECGDLDAQLVGSGAIPILGVAVDQLDAFEQLLTREYRVPTPPLATSLRAQLGCRRVS